jgi:hypothetical protein
VYNPLKAKYAPEGREDLCRTYLGEERTLRDLKKHVVLTSFKLDGKVASPRPLCSRVARVGHWPWPTNGIRPLISCLFLSPGGRQGRVYPVQRRLAPLGLLQRPQAQRRDRARLRPLGMGRRVRNPKKPKKRCLSASPFRCVLNSMKAAALGEHPLPLQAAHLRSADLLSSAQRLRGRRHVCQQPIYGCGAAPPRAQASARSVRRARTSADRTLGSGPRHLSSPSTLCAAATGVQGVRALPQRVAREHRGALARRGTGPAVRPRAPLPARSPPLCVLVCRLRARATGVSGRFSLSLPLSLPLALSLARSLSLLLALALSLSRSLSISGWCQ